MPVISNAGDQKNPAAVALGRLGGLSKSPRKRLDAARARRLAESGTRARKERRAAAAEVLGALIELEKAVSDAGVIYGGGGSLRDTHPARERAALAIERATGAKPGTTNERTK